MKQNIRILIADDHSVVREGLKLMLAEYGFIEIVAEAGDGWETLKLARERRDVDVLLVDMTMPGPHGVELVRRLRDEAPGIPILVFSMHDEDQYAPRVIQAGASGYVSKAAPTSELVLAIRKVADGGVYVTQRTMEHLVSSIALRRAGRPHDRLSNREMEIFLDLAQGRSVSAVAEKLSLSVKTVSTHKSNILLEKMAMNSVADLARYAVQEGLID